MYVRRGNAVPSFFVALFLVADNAAAGFFWFIHFHC